MQIDKDINDVQLMYVCGRYRAIWSVSSRIWKVTVSGRIYKLIGFNAYVSTLGTQSNYEETSEGEK